MSTFFSTLTGLATYVSFVAVGALIGSRKAVRSRELIWLGKFQFAALLLMVAMLGVKLGANDEVVASLGQIGLMALVVTLLAMIGSLLFVYLLRRFVLRLDRYGRPVGSAEGDESGAGGGKADNGSTKWLVLAVVAGMVCGYFVVPESMLGLCSTVIDWGLYLLLLMVGIDMGRQGTIVADIRAAGFKVVLVPVAVAVGTLSFSVLGGVFLGMGVKDSMASTAGFCWYSLAPTLLQSYSLTISAVAFLSNVMREIFAIVAIPFVARKVGYVECVALVGAAGMDSLLPVVVGATHERITIYSFVSGVLLSLAVPMLIPLIVSLPL